MPEVAEPEAPEDRGIEMRLRALVLEDSKTGQLRDTLTFDTDLWNSGMDSMASVRLLVAIEEEFGIEFPDELLTRSTFTSITTMASAVRSLRT
ncbi:phosphopantetheine-binding protein [Streptomyces sp. NPDC002838]|uniref:phosphopantetheine-binding protein n=1 Tax=Streptomyces sp. NPDC002838 TaxID=3154436 RepID=UPI00331830B7